jgi:tRNA threonylcarbamoyladenosine dehydratase
MSAIAPVTETVLPAAYVDRFSGLGRLFGSGAVLRLHAAHVCVVGVGGVGSWVVEALARSGIGALTFVDADDVCVTNTNRQLPALADTVGRPKVAVLAERVRSISPDCRVVPVADFYTPSNARELLAEPFDFVVDAVDRRSTKAHLVHACRELGRSVLVCGAAGGRRDPGQVRVSDLGLAGRDELLRQVRRKLRTEYGWERGRGTQPTSMGVPCVYSPESPIFPWRDGSCRLAPEAGGSLRMDCASGIGAAAFVTGAFGFLAAGEVVRRLAVGLPSVP